MSLQGEIFRHTQREDNHVKTETEIRVMQLQTKECQGLPAASRSWEGTRRDIPLQPSGTP